MRIIQLTENDCGPSDHSYKGQRYDEGTLRHVIRGESATVLKPDGTPLVVFVAKALTANSVQTAFPILRRIDDPPTNRSTTVLGKSEYRKKNDGSLSRTVGLSTGDPRLRGMSSAIIGYYDRHARWPYCRATAFNLAHPEEFAKLLPFVREVNRVFQQHAPERYATQAAVAASTHAAWIIPGTVFSTITVNRNYPAACHLDAGDLRGGFGVMTAMRSGTYTGGVTYWPRFGVGAFMDTGDVCLADVHEYHGVTPPTGTPGRFVRVSCVFYLREKMCRCGSPEQELERAKARKLGQPLYTSEEA